MSGKPVKRPSAARRLLTGLTPRLIGLTVLMALVTGALSGVMLIQTSRGALKKQILASNFSAARLAAEYAARYIEGAETNLRRFAGRKPLLRAALEKNLPEAEAQLAQILDNSALFDNASIYSAQGIGWASGLKNGTWEDRGGSVADREWFQRILATRRPYFGVPVVSRQTGRSAGIYAVPIFAANGKLNAVLTGEISLAALSQSIKDLSVRQAARSSLMDARQGGLIIAHPDPQRIMTPAAGRNQAEVRALAGESGGQEIEHDGESDLAAFAPVPGLPWSVLILEPLSSAYAPLDNLTVQAVLFITAIALLSVLLGILLARSIVRPVRKLVEGIAVIDRGDLDFGIRTNSRDEIGRLSRDFNQMASDLKSVTASRDGLDREVAERKRTEDVLSASEIHYRRLFESAQDGILILDAGTGRIVDANPHLIEMLGFSHEQLTDKSLWDLGFFHDLVASHENLVELQRKEYIHYEDLPLETADGRKIEIEFVSSVYVVNGEKVIQCNIRDITARKRTEAKLRELNEELKRSNLELEQFAYVASHDLQEPLRMVSSYTQLIEKRFKNTLDQDTIDYIAFAVDGANRMQRLIQDLLAYSRISTGGRAMAPVDMCAALGDALLNLQAAIAGSGALVANDELPVVTADRSQIVQLFQNLIDNAVKFQHPGRSPRVHISAVRTPNDPRLWRFSVTDNGIGIDPNQFERIFLIFQRLHGRAEYPGTGIGLAICQRIVNRHGGRLWIESVPGQGSVFYFTLNSEREGD